MYQLKITKQVPNPEYDKQLAEHERTRNYACTSLYPSRTIEATALETTVTDEVFKAIQKAALEAM